MSLGGVPICKQDKNHRIIVGGKTPVLQLVRFIQLNQRLSYKKKKKKIHVSRKVWFQFGFSSIAYKVEHTIITKQVKELWNTYV